MFEFFLFEFKLERVMQIKQESEVETFIDEI